MNKKPASWGKPKGTSPILIDASNSDAPKPKTKPRAFRISSVGRGGKRYSTMVAFCWQSRDGKQRRMAVHEPYSMNKDQVLRFRVWMKEAHEWMEGA